MTLDTLTPKTQSVFLTINSTAITTGPKTATSTRMMGATAKGDPIRIGNGIGLGHDFAKDQNKDGHGGRRNDRATVAEDLDQDCRGKGRGRDIGDIVAKQQRADEPFAAFWSGKAPWRRASCRGVPIP